ncbi:MAG: N-methyl-L-tryptophan oxidase [Gemmatimonadota bacterium]|nr:N-methyl-L-tryptophan oxidase [Gemmatimonadota bacterium]
MQLIVVGLGAVGSAAAWRLAEQGHRVTGFDRWSPPHVNGSTHGETRITRITAWEGAQYVPLVQRANELWRSLPMPDGQTPGRRTGGLFLAPADDLLVAGSIASAEATGVPFEVLPPAEVATRWPLLVPNEQQVGFVDPGAGLLFPERIVRATLARALALGAELRTNEPILSWRADGQGVAVTTARDTHRADALILCTGAWMPRELEPLGVELRVERQTLHWFAPPSGAPPFGPDRAPIHLVADARTPATAVFPTVDGAIKVATHHGGEFSPADAVRRTIDQEEIEAAAAILGRFFPRLAGGAHLRSATCLYTNTPSGDFLLDRHPAHQQVVLGSPCNGFGFKFSAATGEALACLATGDAPPVDLAPWRLPRGPR